MIWRSEEHEPLVERPWDESRAQAAVAAVLGDTEAAVGDGVWPVHPRDAVETPFTSLYLGSAGIVWALRELGSSLDLSSLLARALERYRAEPDEGEAAHAPSLWMGETGLLVVAARLG